MSKSIFFRFAVSTKIGSFSLLSVQNDKSQILNLFEVHCVIEINLLVEDVNQIVAKRFDQRDYLEKFLELIAQYKLELGFPILMKEFVKNFEQKLKIFNLFFWNLFANIPEVKVERELIINDLIEVLFEDWLSGELKVNRVVNIFDIFLFQSFLDLQDF